MAKLLATPVPVPSLLKRTDYAWAGGTTDSRPGEDVNRLADFDYFTLFESVRAAPADFGFVKVLNPACRNCFGSNPVAVPDADSYYLWDEAHPTAAAHPVIGAGAYAAHVPEQNVVVLAFLFVTFHALQRVGDV